MCGIAGIIAREPIDQEWKGRLARMSESMQHRGPNGEGHFASEQVMLAMRRLSIIDVAGGWQPLFNEDRSLALVANGEIYNFVELRQQLEARGHQFASGSDCETIVHLYEEYGTDCVQHLRGMFAFALWDEKRRRVLIARDRMGEKPLYIHQNGEQMIFASEMKALLASGVISPKVDPEAVDLYFHYGYVPEPRTIFNNVRKLDAGWLIVIDVDPWQVAERPYWCMLDAPPLATDPVETIRAELETVAKLTIRSDLPVGVALSGGLDSSAIASLAASHYSGQLKAFSVGYAGRPRCDERADAQQFAEQLGIPFYDVALEVSDVGNTFAQLVIDKDDPIADISGFGYLALMKLARENGCPVLLQGHGGDELFWGYGWVQKAAQDAHHRSTGHGPINRLRRFLPGGKRISLFNRLPDYQIATRSRKSLYGTAMIDQLSQFQPDHIFNQPQASGQSAVQMTRIICDTYLRGNGVVQGDRLSMTESVEMRLPLLDHRLVETVIGLRKAQSDLDSPPKDWLKKAVGNLLPKELINRTKKGFSPPSREWLKIIFHTYGDWILDGQLVRQGILSPKGAFSLKEKSTPPQPVSTLFFKYLVLEIWLRKMNERLHPSFT